MRPFFLSIILAYTVAAVPAAAQSSDVGKRVDRLEQEMRAVQRTVFPNGAGKFLEPDIAPATAATNTGPAASSASAVSDLIARVDALENSLATMTNQVEQNSFRLKKIEDKLAAAEKAAQSEEVIETSAPATAKPTAVAKPTATTSNSVAAKPKPDPSRVDGVKAIAMPQSGDAAEDAYLYGYRLWEAKYYPEAQSQLKKVVATYPSHRRASYAQNLLGRAYLDDGKPALASQELYANYQKMPRGERAPDSLYYLSVALIQLKKKDDACRVLNELEEVYPEVAQGRLNNGIASSKKGGNCK